MGYGMMGPKQVKQIVTRLKEEVLMEPGVVMTEESAVASSRSLVGLQALVLVIVSLLAPNAHRC